ncbi:MAG TPA: toll/interleukin-1 receptor domain-containing protein [Candidatus Accumulibacter phosphatis]|nr:toll/interleukin-1 receptor domain-containing protein [Candidatus Accumulibacter phosphatis]
MCRARVFIAYARNDSVLREQLRTHLAYLVRDKQVDIFFDGLIKPGEPWDAVLKNQITTADVVLFLLSPDLIASDYVMNEELPAALERQKSGKAVIVPILTREGGLPIVFRESDYLQSHDCKAVASSDNRDKAWQTVTKGIEEQVTIVNARNAAREAGILTLSLEEVKVVLGNRLNDSSSVCLCSRTGMGWEQDLRAAICALSKNPDKASMARFLLLDQDGDIFQFDSAIHWEPDSNLTDNPAQFFHAAYTPDQRKQAAKMFYNDLHNRGHRVRVTNVFLPQAFWAIATDGSAIPNNVLIEVPVWRSRHGGNLYIEATGKNKHVMAYAAIFDDLWAQAIDWPTPSAPN